MTMPRRAFLEQLVAGSLGVAVESCISSRAFAATHGDVSLPRSLPETQGVSSAAVLDFLTAVKGANLELHSLMVVRHGHVIAEGWWAPYRAQSVHTLYSLTKSFTSTAVGCAVAEGLLKVDDPVIAFFPQDLPEKVSSNLAALRVEHLLTMSAGHAEETNATITAEEDWVKAFLRCPIEHAPRQRFSLRQRSDLHAVRYRASACRDTGSRSICGRGCSRRSVSAKCSGRPVRAASVSVGSD